MNFSLSPLTICGLDELAQYRTRGVTHVLSILDPGRPEPGPLQAYNPHHRTTLHFHDAIEPGSGLLLPDVNDVEVILAFGRGIPRCSAACLHVLVHCHKGVSRSTAAVLMLEAQAHPHADEDRLFARLREIRPQAWPNSRMVGFADELLGRGGRLVVALERHYAHQLAARPEFAGSMQQAGRGREVELGLKALC
jgi:predicted protein tyrosine phosphatase